jgi:hypothetical protein
LDEHFQRDFSLDPGSSGHNVNEGLAGNEKAIHELTRNGVRRKVRATFVDRSFVVFGTFPQWDR